MLRGLKVQGMGLLASGGDTATTLKQRVWCGRHLKPHSVYPLPTTGKKCRRGVVLKVPRKLALRNVDTKMAQFMWTLDSHKS